MIIEFITLSESGKQSRRWKPFYPLSLRFPYFVALTPEDIKIREQDEHLKPISTETDADIIAMTIPTSIAPRAYKLGKQFNQQGKTVIYGGLHINSIMKYPEFKDEPFQYGGATAIFIGETEETYPQFLKDFKRGKVKKIYEGGTFNYKRKIIPRRDFVKRGGLTRFLHSVWYIESSRGCPRNCSFCISTSNYRTKPVEDLIAEIEEIDCIDKGYLHFVDVNFGGNRKRINELLDCLEGRNLKWGASIFLPDLDRNTIKRLAKAGCQHVYVSFESFNNRSLDYAYKRFDNVDIYEEKIKQLHDEGIIVIGSFTFGFDYDDKSIFERTLKYMIRIKLDDAAFHILTPYPGTQIFDQYRSQGRLRYTNLPNDWERYNRCEVVFMPEKMAPEELKEGQRQLMRDFYSLNSIYHRMRRRIFSKKGTFFQIINILKYMKTR